MRPLLRPLLYHILIPYAVLAVYLCLSEFQILPTHIIGNPYAQYILDIASVALTISGVFFSVRLFEMARIRQSFERAQDEVAQHRAYRRWCLVRQYFLWGCLMGCALIYYLSEASNTAHYALLILLLTNLFCLPSAKEFAHTFHKDTAA